LLDFGEELTIYPTTKQCNYNILSRTPIEKLKLRYIVILIIAIVFPLSVCENSI
jgi:hypothetical protein